MFLRPAAPAAAQEGRRDRDTPGSRGSEGTRPQGHHKPQRWERGGSTPRPPEQGQDQSPVSVLWIVTTSLNFRSSDSYLWGAHDAKRPFHLSGVSHRMLRIVGHPGPAPSAHSGRIQVSSCPHRCLHAPLMPPCPLPVPVPLTGSPEPARAPQHRPQPQQRHPRATRAARMRCPAAPARGTPGARVPPLRTTAPMVQRGRAPRPLAAVAAPTGWVGTIAAPGTRRRVREAPEPGEHGGARLTRASPARDRRVSGRASDGHHRSQVLRPQQPSALHLSPHSVPAALVPCPSIAADGRYRSVRCPTGGATVVGE